MCNAVIVDLHEHWVRSANLSCVLAYLSTKPSLLILLNFYLNDKVQKL